VDTGLLGVRNDRHASAGRRRGRLDTLHRGALSAIFVLLEEETLHLYLPKRVNSPIRIDKSDSGLLKE